MLCMHAVYVCCVQEFNDKYVSSMFLSTNQEINPTVAFSQSLTKALLGKDKTAKVNTNIFCTFTATLKTLYFMEELKQ